MPSVNVAVRFVKKASDYGTYWTSTAPKAQLLASMRAHATTRMKYASDSTGGDPEQGFEQSFSSLAYCYLKDKAPRLLDYIIGFQLVDRNEDNTKAMGIFGFKVGDQWLYAPVFFLNGDLKGHELLYLKKSDTFVPMKENWVNHIISRKPHNLGKGSERNTFELGGLLPNLSRLAKPPVGTKYGADTPSPVHVDDWAKPFLPFCFALMTKQARGLYPQVKTGGDLAFQAVVEHPFKAAFAEVAQKFDMRTVLQDYPLLKIAFEQCYQRYPRIKMGFDRFYGKNFFADMARTVVRDGDDLVKRANSMKFTRPTKKKKMSPYLFPDEEEKPAFDKASEIEIIALDVDPDAPGGIAIGRADLDDTERAKLLKDTILIKDKRDPHSDRSSVAYNTQVRFELSSPDATGLYSVLEKPGTFDEMLVISNPHTGRGKENFCLVVRKSDPRSWKNTDRGNLWVQQNKQPTDTDYRKWVNGLGGVDSLVKGGTYIAISEMGEGTCPFTVREAYGDGTYKVEWKDSVAWGESRLKSRHGMFESYDLDYDNGYSSYNAKLRINDREGSKLRSNRGELSVPNTFKILKVKDPPKPKKNKDDLVECCSPSFSGDDGESKETPIQPGNLIDVQLLIEKQAATNFLKIHDTGANEVSLKSVHRGEERMSKKAALISLVRDHGLREEQARSMLKEAEKRSVNRLPAVYIVKYAYGYGGVDLQSGKPGAPAFPPPMTGMEQNGPNSVQSIYPQEEFMPVDSMSSQQTDTSIYDPFYTPDSQSMQQAQEASSSGQKEVFDASMLSGMLKSVGKNDRVDKYLGDLMKALDKIARILFMFYWHNEEFENRYGKQDLPELEDSLRNTFEALGDLVLFLKEKTVEGQHGMDMGGSVGDSSEAEPSVHDTART